MNLLRNVCISKPPNTKSFFGALNIIFNRVNEKRIREVGADRACAEWLMRNGALIRWKGQPTPLASYNQLPLDPEDKGVYQIEEVIAHEASITHHGFDHFYGCEHVNAVSFEKCWYFGNSCLDKLKILAPSLVSLEVTHCAEVTDEGLSYIAVLKNLQELKLRSLEGVNDIDGSIGKLKAALPSCNITKD